jgi:uncharacterized protein YggT (Ycf19 family)
MFSIATCFRKVHHFIIGVVIFVVLLAAALNMFESKVCMQFFSFLSKLHEKPVSFFILLS